MRKITKFLACSILLCIPLIVFSSQINEVNNSTKSDLSLIPRSILFQQQTKRAITLSPNGRFLAYVGPDEDGKSYLWIKELFATIDPQKVIPYQHADGIRKILWQFDNKHLLIASDQNMNMNVHLYQIEIGTGKIRDLTPINDVFTQIIAYYPKNPQKIIVRLVPMNPNEEEKKNWTPPGLHQINLDTAEMIPYAENPGNVVHWGIDQNLNIICNLSVIDDQIQINVKDHYTWRPLITKSMDGNIGDLTTPFMGFSKNKELFLLSNLDNDASRLLKVNLDSGSYKIVAEDPQYDLSPTVIFSHNDSKILFSGAIREKFEHIVIEKDFEGDLKTLKDHYPGIVKILETDLSSRIWLVLHESDVEPPSYFAYNCTTQHSELLFKENQKINDYKLCNTQPISFTAQDGMKIYGYLTLPAIEAKNLPAVILVHGGPWGRDRWNITP